MPITEFVDYAIDTIGLYELDNLKIFDEPCKKLKISRPSYLILLAIMVLLLFIVIGLADRLFTDLLCFIFPGYKCMGPLT